MLLLSHFQIANIVLSLSACKPNDVMLTVLEGLLPPLLVEEEPDEEEEDDLPEI